MRCTGRSRSKPPPEADVREPIRDAACKHLKKPPSFKMEWERCNVSRSLVQSLFKSENAATQLQCKQREKDANFSREDRVQATLLFVGFLRRE